MKRELPKTLVGHGIAVFISARGVAETPAKELTEPFGDCKIAVIGSIESYNPVTGAFTATLKRGVPAQLPGNKVEVSGSLGTLHGAPIPPGTFATHVTATSTIDGHVENPAATVYLGALVGDDGKAYHEAVLLIRYLRLPRAVRLLRSLKRMRVVSWVGGACHIIPATTPS